MSKFLTGKELNDTIDDIIWNAKETLLIVSPYIKLDNHFKKLFDKLRSNPSVHIIIVFGKNEGDIRKSLSQHDFEHFKNFPNISIVYVPNLHAKYYANENKGILTSINLYDYSFENNIEFGVYSEQTLFSQFSKNHDADAWNTCIEIANNNDAIFINRPVYQTKKFIINIEKKHIGTTNLLDNTDNFYGFRKGKYKQMRLDDFPNELDENSIEKPIRNYELNKTEKTSKPKYERSDISYGFCIRTGEQIKYNPDQPMSFFAWKTWNEFGDVDYPEKFCHKTGKNSYGKTSVRNPILE